MLVEAMARIGRLFRVSASTNQELMGAQQFKKTIPANLNVIVLEAFIDHAMQLTRAHARLALANRLNFLHDTLIKEVKL
jgi:hypothetical protein